ncbi:unnamed protein product [Brassica rapa subsp. trilocularis]
METSRKRSSSGLLSRSSDSVAGAEEEAAEEEAGTCHRLRSPWVVEFERGSLGGNVAGESVDCDSDEKIEPDHLLVLVHGILARHAVAVLYSAAVSQASDGAALSNSGNSHLPRGSLAGLEPMNFITLATPHLGVRTESRFYPFPVIIIGTRQLFSMMLKR